MNHISLAKKAGFDVICKVTWTSNEKVLCKVTHRARQVLSKLWESIHPGMKLLMGQDSVLYVLGGWLHHFSKYIMLLLMCMPQIVSRTLTSYTGTSQICMDTPKNMFWWLHFRKRGYCLFVGRSYINFWLTKSSLFYYCCLGAIPL